MKLSIIRLNLVLMRLCSVNYENKTFIRDNEPDKLTYCDGREDYLD